jgi:membrane-associated phospholipid phosphatase
MPVWYAFWFLPPLAMAFAIAFTGTNREIFVWMQHASHVVPADVFSVFWQSATYAGDGLAVFALSALFLHRRPHAVWAGLLAAIPGGIITHGLKALHPFARPAVVLGRDAITILGPELHRSSFPSGHALSVGILAGIVFLSYRSHAVRTIALVFAAVVAVSRVAVGVHWPFDIAVGFAGGWLSAWIGWILVVDMPWYRTSQATFIMSVILLGCAVALCFHAMGLPGAAAYRYGLALLTLLLSAASATRNLPAVGWRAGHRGPGAALSTRRWTLSPPFTRAVEQGGAGPGASPPAAR